MNNIEKRNNDEQYDLLIEQISLIVSDSKRFIANAVNRTLVETYWTI